MPRRGLRVHCSLVLEKTTKRTRESARHCLHSTLYLTHCILNRAYVTLTVLYPQLSWSVGIYILTAEMCCSSRKSGIKAYTYTDTTSPWNRKTLFILWATEVIFSVFVVVFGGALLPSKQVDHRGDDGMSEAIYIMYKHYSS